MMIVKEEELKDRLDQNPTDEERQIIETICNFAKLEQLLDERMVEYFVITQPNRADEAGMCQSWVKGDRWKLVKVERVDFSMITVTLSRKYSHYHYDKYAEDTAESEISMPIEYLWNLELYTQEIDRVILNARLKKEAEQAKLEQEKKDKERETKIKAEQRERQEYERLRKKYESQANSDMPSQPIP